jgi:hypothetical protein
MRDDRAWWRATCPVRTWATAQACASPRPPTVARAASWAHRCSTSPLPHQCRRPHSVQVSWAKRRTTVLQGPPHWVHTGAARHPSRTSTAEQILTLVCEVTGACTTIAEVPRYLNAHFWPQMDTCA